MTCYWAKNHFNGKPVLDIPLDISGQTSVSFLNNFIIFLTLFGQLYAGKCFN